MSLLPENELVRWLALDAQATDREVKETALDRLGTLSESSEILSAALADPDPEIRGTAAANLGRSRRPEAMHSLLNAARNETSGDVRRYILGAFEGYCDPAIANLLLDELARADSDYLIRMEVVTQLWKYDSVVAWPRLVEVVLKDNSDIVRIHAAETLELLDEVCAHDSARQQFWLRLADDDHPGIANIAARTLARKTVIPAASVLEAISRRLQSAVTEERAFALHRLSMLAPPSAHSLAVQLLGDQQSQVRVACCACLGAIRDAAAIAPLLAVLRSDPEPRVQAAVLVGLENYRTAAIGDALLQLLDVKSPSGDPLSILCRQLWKYPSRRTVELLRGVLASSVRVNHRPVVESALAFIERLVSGQLRSPA